MMTRILTAAAGIPLMLVCLFWPGGWPWFALVSVVGLFGVYEYTRALAVKGVYVHWVALTVMLAVLFVASAPVRLPAADTAAGWLWWHPLLGRVAPAVVVLFLLVGDLAWARRAPVKNVGATLFGFAWLGLLVFLLTLRRNASFAEGPVLIVAVLLIVWAVDSAAYFMGKAWGKHKCTPSISPNKTWEGIIGGLVAAALVGGIVAAAVQVAPTIPESTGKGLLFGLLVGAAGQFGDLVESAVKREFGIKDFGSLLPGHGGMLDRFDSLMLAAPVAYLLLWSYLNPALD